MTQGPNTYEEQLMAMRAVMEALAPLGEEARDSVLTWINGQFGHRHLLAAGSAVAASSEGLAPRSSQREGTVSVVAQKIGAKSARDLFLAAAAHLTLYQGQDSFTRDELVACAKEARGWKSGYSNQIAMSIGRMLDAGTLFEKAKNLFSLSEESLSKLEGTLSS